MVYISTDSASILDRLRAAYPDVDPLSHKFRVLVAAELERYPHLTDREIINLFVGSFGSVVHRKPTNLPATWKLTWCKKFMAPRYNHPDPDEDEYVVVLPHISRGFLPSLVHRTPQGWADAQWFLEIVPQLQQIINDSRLGTPFSKKFNAYVNALFGNEMTPGQVQAFNLFFEKFVPGIEGICTSCFNVSLPDTGAGEKWISKTKGLPWEVRLSAAKPWGLPGQRLEYVSHAELDPEGNRIYGTWSKQREEKGFDITRKQEDTHIPWDVYDFNKFSVNMPVCTCTI